MVIGEAISGEFDVAVAEEGLRELLLSEVIAAVVFEDLVVVEGG